MLPRHAEEEAMNDDLLLANEQAAILAGMVYDQRRGWFKPDPLPERLFRVGRNTSTHKGTVYINSTDQNNTHGSYIPQGDR